MAPRMQFGAKSLTLTKADYYRSVLRALDDWEPYLLAESGLPGPRGNLELAQAVADEGREEQFRRWLALRPDVAPVNSPEEFLAFCGVVGLGRLLAEGRRDVLGALRLRAADLRWRTREAVAMALQRWGDADMDALVREMAGWAHGDPWEQRAAAAALCEPRLLRDPEHASAVLRILDEITAGILDAPDRKSEARKVLRRGLGYCWSVAVAACPHPGKALMEKWLANPDLDIRWIMRENLRKSRLARMDPVWTAWARQQLA
jgi:hypothetical protein